MINMLVFKNFICILLLSRFYKLPAAWLNDLSFDVCFRSVPSLNHRNLLFKNFSSLPSPCMKFSDLAFWNEENTFDTKRSLNSCVGKRFRPVFSSPEIVQMISHFWWIFQNLKIKGRKFVPWRRFAKMRRGRQGPVMVAGEPGSVPETAQSALCLQLPTLPACKTLGSRAHIQAFRRPCARFLNERARPDRSKRGGSKIWGIFRGFIHSRVSRIDKPPENTPQFPPPPRLNLPWWRAVASARCASPPCAQSTPHYKYSWLFEILSAHSCQKNRLIFSLDKQSGDRR